MSTLLDGYNSLASDENKVSTTDQPIGVDLLPELTLSMEDKDLLDLAKLWRSRWEPYAKEIAKKQKDNEKYWMGEQFTATTEGRPLVDNLIFEALETFLPIATRPKADPLVESDNSELGNAISDKVRKMLMHLADILSYNLKVKQVTRYWAIYLLGAMKVGWSTKENNITCAPIRTDKLVLDPDATVEECEYSGYYVGEELDDIASDLVLRFPRKEAQIKEKVQDKMGTKVLYTLWTTDEYFFWQMGEVVLAKIKNPHWNYDSEQPAPVDAFGAQSTDPTTGQPLTQTVQGHNHFSRPKKPYVFLSVFSLGKHPHDDANVITQSLPLQDLINKRLAQIDKNADNTNGGLVVSGDAFTKEQAASAAKALRKGGTIYVPTGSVESAVKRDTGTPLPTFVYESLLDYRNELRNIFGTRGSTPQGTIGEQTVRGKLVTKGQDADRIGGGVSTYLEAFSDAVFNWFVQLMYVYYDEPHVASILGKERATEYIQLINSELSQVKLLVGVKEGSMVPHDPLNKRNEAIELWAAQGIDPITFFDRLEFPNPREAAKQLFLWKANPIALFPDLQAQAQQAQAQAQGQQQVAEQGAKAQDAAYQEKAAQADHQRELQKAQLEASYNQVKQ